MLPTLAVSKLGEIPAMVHGRALLADPPAALVAAWERLVQSEKFISMQDNGRRGRHGEPEIIYERLWDTKEFNGLMKAIDRYQSFIATAMVWEAKGWP